MKISTKTIPVYLSDEGTEHETPLDAFANDLYGHLLTWGIGNSDDWSAGHIADVLARKAVELRDALNVGLAQLVEVPDQQEQAPARKTPEELRALYLEGHEFLVRKYGPLPQHVVHRKTGERYIVQGAILAEDTLALEVRYSAEGPHYVWFRRPLKEFLEKYDLYADPQRYD